MTDKELHDLKNSLHRLEIMVELLHRQDFTTFSEAEIKQDAASELDKLRRAILEDQ